MTFYYVATSAILLAITNIFKNNSENLKVPILILALFGLLISIFWHFSCKGYCYWSKSWMKIILRLERKVIEKNTDLGVYSIFSGEIDKNENSIIIPNKAANISTPKLSLLFSWIAIWSWLCFLIYHFMQIDSFCELKCKIVIIIFSLILLIVFYSVLLPKWTISREGKSHYLFWD